METSREKESTKTNENNYEKPLIRQLCDFTEPVAYEEDPDCLFQNQWLRKGNCGLIIATSGIGKSSFTMQAAVHWGMGIPMLEICPTRPLKSLVLETEDDEYDIVNFRNGTRTGLATEFQWESNKVIEAETNVFVGISQGLIDDTFFSWMRSAILEVHPDLVIINPLHAFFGGNLNESHTCSKFLRQGLDPIIKTDETKCGVLMVHHTGKPKENTGSSLPSYLGNGSAELTNYPRAILSMRPYKNIPGVFELLGAKHGDRLNWRDSSGHLTTRKIICYANKLERYADKGRVIYWVSPTPDELELLAPHKEHLTNDGSQSQTSHKKDNDKGANENALSLVTYVKSEPSKTITNESLREYAAKQWMTHAARKAVKQFESIRLDHNIGKDGRFYTHGN